MLSTRDTQGKHYIAHAGGIIDGYTYTNSLEAVENAINNGINYIELDLSITSDGYLVASHGWIGMNSVTQGDRPTLDEFKRTKVYGRFTTLTYTMIDSIMMANPRLNLVTDKISTPRIINQYFGKYKDRVWVECFHLSHYYRLKWRGFNVLMSAQPKTKEYMKRHIYSPQLWLEIPVQNYTFGSDAFFDSETLHGEQYAISTCPNRRSADSIFNQHPKVKWIYVEDISK